MVPTQFSALYPEDDLHPQPQGQRYGLIGFDSRIDLLLPAAAEIDVVRGGETIVAFLKEPPGA